jgi:oxygen-dependent protoporphyrinogen oxidase
MEPFILPRRSGEDESLADFARRRLGREAFEVLVAPMLAGIFAGDPEKLSVKSTFPQLLEMEKTGGVARSLWVRRRARSPRPKGISTFMTLKSGLSRVTEEIAKSLPPGTVHTDCPVGALRRHGGHWEVVTPKGVFEADTVIAALPSPALADAVDGMDPELGMRLREIPFASTATVTMIYDAATFPKPPRGFGFLSALGESMTLTAATFASSKFPQRCPKDKVVIRCFVGGAGREESAEGAVMRIQSRVREDLERVLGVKGVSPRAVKTTRWLSANPQYNIGHSRRLDRLTSCLKSYFGLILAGSSYHGVGLPDCVKSGRRAAQMAFAHHSGRRHEFSESGLA